MHGFARLHRIGVGSLLVLTGLAFFRSDAALNAQPVEQRWDGLIEEITVATSYYPPTPPPADGPSRMTRRSHMAITK